MEICISLQSIWVFVVLRTWKHKLGEEDKGGSVKDMRDVKTRSSRRHQYVTDTDKIPEFQVRLDLITIKVRTAESYTFHYKNL